MQPDDSGAARSFVRLEAERAVPEAAALREHPRTKHPRRSSGASNDSLFFYEPLGFPGTERR